MNKEEARGKAAPEEGLTPEKGPAPKETPAPEEGPAPEKGPASKETPAPEAEDRPGQRYVEMICRLYGDVYDDREEDSRIRGLNWQPGVRASHKSLNAFQRELEEQGLHLSRTKLQKILITGGCWTTERSREVQALYEEYTDPPAEGGRGLAGREAVREIAALLNVSTVSVIINLPYGKVVYDLEDKSENARRIARCRKRKK